MATYKKPKTTRTKAEQADAEQHLSDRRKGFLAWYDSSAGLRARTEENFKFNRGGEDQWDKADADKLKKEKRPVLSFNMISPVVNFLAGYEWDRRKDLRYFPRGSEDEQIGRLATALAKYSMDAGKGDLQRHRLFRRGIIGSQAALYLCLNYNYTDDLVEGDLDFDVLEKNSFYYDPFARRPDRNDGQFYGMLLWMPYYEAQRKWPKHQAQLEPGVMKSWMGSTDELTGVPRQVREVFYREATKQVRVLREFYRKPVEVVLLANHAAGEYERMASGQEAEAKLKQIRDTAGKQVAAAFSIETANSQTALVNKASGQMQPFLTPEEAEQALDGLKQQVGDSATAAFEIITRPTTTLRMCHYCGWELLDDQPSPYGRTDEEGDVIDVDWRFPFATFIPYQDDDDFDSIKGVVDDIKDPQREGNWHYATMQDKMVRGHKGMIWVLKGEHTDMNSLRQKIAQAGFLGEYTASPPIYIPPPSVIQEEAAVISMMLEAVMRITGVNAELMGQTTQKTVSGRSIQARQAGGLVGVSSLLMNWRATEQYLGDLLIRRIQQFYSVAKMDRIIGDDQRITKAMGLFGEQSMVIPNDAMFAKLKALKNADFDVVVEFQDAAPTARQAVLTQLMQLTAAGVPVPPDIMVEASDAPRKDEIQAALKKQGMGPPQPELARAISAGQGSAAMPNGVNAS